MEGFGDSSSIDKYLPEAADDLCNIGNQIIHCLTLLNTVRVTVPTEVIQKPIVTTVASTLLL